MKWPADKDTLFAVYPVDGRFDIRIMGGAKSVLQVLDQRTTPKGWSVYDTDELPVSDFLYSLDYFVFFQHPKAVEAFGRAILEALAAGTLVILPEQFRSVFGNAAVYCEPGEVEGQVRQFHCDFNLYKRQLRRAKAVLREHFSYESYSERIRSILGQDLLEGYTK